MIKYRKNEKWGTYSFKCDFNYMDDEIQEASKEIQTQNSNYDIDIMDISIRSTETIDKEYDVSQKHFVTIIYALISKDNKKVMI